MRTLKEDFFTSTPDVERNWLRRIELVCGTIVGLVVIIPVSIFQGWYEILTEFTILYWNKPSDESPELKTE